MEVAEEEVLHDPLHLTEALAEADWRPGESLDEASLVLLPIKPEDETLLTGINNSVSPETQINLTTSYQRNLSNNYL